MRGSLLQLSWETHGSEAYTNVRQRYPNSYPNYPNFDLLPQ
jgi:hypothetical protein